MHEREFTPPCKPTMDLRAAWCWRPCTRHPKPRCLPPALGCGRVEPPIVQRLKDLRQAEAAWPRGGWQAMWPPPQVGVGRGPPRSAAAFPSVPPREDPGERNPGCSEVPSGVAADPAGVRCVATCVAVGAALRSSRELHARPCALAHRLPVLRDGSRRALPIPGASA